MLWPARATRFLPVRPHSVFPSVVVQLLLLQGGGVSKTCHQNLVSEICSSQFFSNIVSIFHLIELCLCALQKDKSQAAVASALLL